MDTQIKAESSRVRQWSQWALIGLGHGVAPKQDRRAHPHPTPSVPSGWQVGNVRRCEGVPRKDTFYAPNPPKNGCYVLHTHQ